MLNLLNHKFFKEYSGSEWFLMKLSVVLLWIETLSNLSIGNREVLYPSGICAVVNCSIILSEYTIQFFLILATLLSALYMFEKWMTATTFLMFLVSLLLFTLEDSNGVLNRCSLYTMTFLAQSVAYYRSNTDLSNERIQFPIQIIAAGYFLAGLSKLNETGLSWVTDAPMASLQIIKNYSYAYFDSGNLETLNQGIDLANFALNNSLTIKILFGISLFLELFSWLALKNKMRAFFFGLLLLSMHLGIMYFMNILIRSIYYPMLIFLVNPLYLIYKPLNKGYYYLKDVL